MHPHLAAACSDVAVERFDDSALADVDIVFAALPHGHSQRIAQRFWMRAFLLWISAPIFGWTAPTTYERWYGHAHEAPELLGSFAYGIPELHRDAIRCSKAVAAAGCYATAAILALKPLVDAGWSKRTASSSMRRRASAERAVKRRKRLPSARSKAVFRLWPAQPSPHGRNGNGNRRHGAVHAALSADDSWHSCDLLCDRHGAVRPAGALHAAYEAEPFVRVTPDRPPRNG